MAKTTGVIGGNMVLVYVGGTAIGCTTGATFNGTNEQIETTCKDNDGAKTYTDGSQDWSIEVQGNTKFDATYGFDELVTAWKSKTEVTVKFGTDNVDDPYLEGAAFISAFSWEGPLNAPSTWSITFSPKGPIYLFNS